MKKCIIVLGREDLVLLPSVPFTYDFSNEYNLLSEAYICHFKCEKSVMFSNFLPLDHLRLLVVVLQGQINTQTTIGIGSSCHLEKAIFTLRGV